MIPLATQRLSSGNKGQFSYLPSHAWASRLVQENGKQKIYLALQAHAEQTPEARQPRLRDSSKESQLSTALLLCLAQEKAAEEETIRDLQAQIEDDTKRANSLQQGALSSPCIVPWQAARSRRPSPTLPPARRIALAYRHPNVTPPRAEARSLQNALSLEEATAQLAKLKPEVRTPFRARLASLVPPSYSSTTHAAYRVSSPQLAEAEARLAQLKSGATVVSPEEREKCVARETTSHARARRPRRRSLSALPLWRRGTAQTALRELPLPRKHEPSCDDNARLLIFLFSCSPSPLPAGPRPP